MPKNSCIMQIWAESGKSALPICNYSQILYQFLTFTQNLKRSQEFKSRDIGQIGTYINIVDDIVKMDSDGKTIGLIICKEKNNVLAKYAVNSSNEPIAISAYELSNFLPENLATLLPSTDELESRLLLDEAVNENDNNNQ